MYSASMSKSVLSYLIGKAYCDGRIDSLEDPLIKYIPELKDSYYGKVKIIESLNMAAGDGKLYSDDSGGLGGDWGLYVLPLWNKEASVLQAVKKLGDQKQPK